MGLNFFFLFCGQSHPVLAKIMLESGILFFLNFFDILFGIFLPGSSMNGIRVKKFFLAFLACLIPFWLKRIPERGFSIFWIILLFFSEFSCPGRVWMEFGAQSFFSLFRPVLSRFGYKKNAGKRFFNFLIFFYFFRNFFARVEYEQN